MDVKARLGKFNGWDPARRRRAALSFSIVFGIVVFLIGAYSIAKAGSSNAGSPGGWLLLTLGIISLFVAFGIVVGAYSD
jgi:hypothetical protein